METLVRVDGNRHGTGRVGHTEFQERNQGLKLEWRIEK